MSKISRRSFIAWAGPALVSAPAALSVLPSAAADPHERARRAWADFCAAMDEIADDANGGWFLLGAGNRKPYGNLPGGSFITPVKIQYVVEQEPRVARGSMLVERHEPIEWA